MNARNASYNRSTRETRIELSLNLDGSGKFSGGTGIGFFDHMLEALAKHGALDLDLKAEGDRHIDDHHLVEDVGIVLGEALQKALGAKEGISRYGWALLPMDEALGEVALDLSGRPFLVIEAAFKAARIGTFDVSLVKEFFQAMVNHGRFNLHMRLRAGENAHHGVEILFKAFARALRQAVAIDARVQGVPSTKGSLGE